jgi:hypothetical protein
MTAQSSPIPVNTSSEDFGSMDEIIFSSADSDFGDVPIVIYFIIPFFLGVIQRRPAIR